MSDGAGTHPLRELVFEYLERAEREGSGVLDELCARHPELAGALRARVSILNDSGLDPSGKEAQHPDRLGDFRLLERIGGGGMGVVYRAVDESLGREVALKLVRPSELYFPGARARFQREVEAVARLAHPGIVPVYSAGEEQGVPFFAMERIEGCTLSEALAVIKGLGRPLASLTGDDMGAAIARATEDAERATSASPVFRGTWSEVCARIVREVAEALEHAHRRGVLHRDVKPSNVMVTRGGRVMLLDFGLSSAEGVDRITHTGSAMGSLPYMSPEQLEGDWESLDERSDVYALGVTLYELLTLRLPFREQSLAAMRGAVLEGRAESPRRGNPRASWELETIVRAAMDPEPGRRYHSAAAVASDLSAALDGRPIAARRAGALRRVRRWIQRHPAGAAALMLLALLVIGGPALYAWQQHHARVAIEDRNRVIEVQSDDLAAKNEELAAALADLRSAMGRAEVNFERALAAVDTMLTRIAEVDLRDVPHLHGLRKDVLEEALAFYLEFLEERGPDERLRRETARAWGRVGNLYGLLHRTEDAAQAFEHCIARLEGLSAESPDDTLLLVELADVRQLEVYALRQLGRRARAERSVRRAMAELERAVELAPDEPEPALDRLGLSVNLAQVLREDGRWNEALAELAAVLPALEEAHERYPEKLAAVDHLARAHHMLGVLWVESSPASAAERSSVSRRSEEHHARAIELLEPLLVVRPDDVELRRELARGFTNLGSAMLGRGAVEEAEPLLARGAGLSEALCADYPGALTYVDDQATAWISLGAARAALDRYDDGVALVRRAADAFEELVAAEPHNVSALRKLAGAQLQEATLCWKIGRDLDRTLLTVERAIGTHERALAIGPRLPQTTTGLEWCHDLRAAALFTAGDVEGAGEATLALAALVTDRHRRASVALRLAKCADVAEGAPDLGQDERTALAAECDRVAVALLEQALDQGLSPGELVADPDFAPLLARPEAAALLEARVRR